MAKNDYQDRGCDIAADEIFISDGAKCDSGNIQEIFAKDNKIAVCDPVYPVYVDTNVMAGRTGTYDPKTCLLYTSALAIVSGMVCDGAKASCAAKIAESVDAGILGYNMYLRLSLIHISAL